MKKFFKKSLLFSSCVVLVWLGLAAMSYGAAVVSVTSDQISSPAVGEELHFNIQITGGKGVAGYRLTLGFDPTALRYIDSANADYLPAGTFASSTITSVNSVHLSAASATGVAPAENGTLATVKFEVVAAKSSVIKLMDVILFDSTRDTAASHNCRWQGCGNALTRSGCQSRRNGKYSGSDTGGSELRDSQPAH